MRITKVTEMPVAFALGSIQTREQAQHYINFVKSRTSLLVEEAREEKRRLIYEEEHIPFNDSRPLFYREEFDAYSTFEQRDGTLIYTPRDFLKASHLAVDMREYCKDIESRTPDNMSTLAAAYFHFNLLPIHLAFVLKKNRAPSIEEIAAIYNNVFFTCSAYWARISFCPFVAEKDLLSLLPNNTMR